MKGKAFLWADIYEAFKHLPNKSDILSQFLDFMKTHGLSPGQPIKKVPMVGFIQSKGFLTTLENCANRLNDNFNWDFFPERYLRDECRAVTNRWGRIAIEFATPEWKPTITVGFLIDEEEHGVKFVNSQKGIDLLLRLEASPDGQKNISPALVELRRKRINLLDLAPSVLLLEEPGNENNHSLLIIRSCLGNIIEKAVSQQGQLEAIYQTVEEWGKILFNDDTLEMAFKRAGLDSGM